MFLLSSEEHQMELNDLNTSSQRTPWNKGRVIGQKAPLKLKEIWAIRFRLQDSERFRELALFNLAIDSKLRGCDLVRLKVNDVAQRRPGAIPRHCRAAENWPTRPGGFVFFGVFFSILR